MVDRASEEIVSTMKSVGWRGRSIASRIPAAPLANLDGWRAGGVTAAIEFLGSALSDLPPTA
jgi:hypothetical protein